MSYRDPNCAKTLDIYDNTAAALQEESSHITGEVSVEVYWFGYHPYHISISFL